MEKKNTMLSKLLIIQISYRWVDASANALELCLSCTNPSLCSVGLHRARGKARQIELTHCVCNLDYQCNLILLISVAIALK